METLPARSKSSPSPPPAFVWHTVDVRSVLPAAWAAQIAAVARRAKAHDLLPTSVTSREAADVEILPVLTVEGDVIARELRWLDVLYRTTFRALAEEVLGQTVSAARNVRYGVNLNVQRGAAMRYEAHVDSNPVGGLLYATTHPPGFGGELVVSNRGDVRGVDEIVRDCSRIYPIAGHLVLFDARQHTHYVAPLRDQMHERIACVLNFYTDDSPETARPNDLTQHLFGPDHSQLKEAQYA